MNPSVALTIGMIVKNEKEHLETCLRSLEPLRQALPCQLILTDTGSEDGTQDIAKRYADDYLEFSWCDDFSKARNTGVELAKGRWFLYIDADHQLDESILSLIPFLSTPSVDDLYDSASVTILNYTGSRDHITGSFTQQRPLLVNFSKGKRYFQHRIHESIPVHPHRSYTLPATIVHWGYLDKERPVKSQRNRRLLQEQMKEDPLNLKHHLQLLKDVDTPQEQKELLCTAIALGESNPQTPTDPRLMLLYTHLLKLAIQQKDWTLFAQTQDRRPDEYTSTVLHCEYLGLCLHAALLRGHMTQVLSLFAQFRPLFFQFLEKPDSEYGMMDSYFYAQESFYYQMEAKVLPLLQKEGTSSSLLLLQNCLTQSKGLSYSIRYDNQTLFLSYLHLLTEQGLSHQIATHYPAMVASSVLCPLFYEFAQSTQRTKDFFSGFVRLPPDYFTSLCQVWVDGVSSLSPEQTSALSAQEDLYTNPLSSVLVYALMQEQQDPFSLLTRCTTETLLAHSQRLWTQVPEFLPLMVRSLGEEKSKNALALEKYTALCAHQLLTHLLEQGKEEEARTLFPVVQVKLAQYCHKVYTDLVVQGENVDLISPPERLALAYERHEAQQTAQSNEVLLACFKEHPLFSAFLPLVTAPKIQPTTSPLDATRLKEQMLQLLQTGQKEEALSLFHENKTLFPDLLDGSVFPLH